jgi:hypothetical protein
MMTPWPGSSVCTTTRPRTWICFQNQAGKWKAAPGLAYAQRAGLAEALIAQLRQVNAEVLAVADGLSRGTIDTVLAKSDLKLGIEALMRGMPP